MTSKEESLERKVLKCADLASHLYSHTYVCFRPKSHLCHARLKMNHYDPSVAFPLSEQMDKPQSRSVCQKNPFVVKALMLCHS